MQLTAVRLIPTASGAPDTTLLPPLVARRLDDRHVRAEIYLEAGDYLISASAASGKISARSQPVVVQIAHVDAPPIAAVEDFFEFSDDGETALVQYRTPDGVIRRYVTQSYTETVTLNAGQTLNLPWSFDVGPASNRAQVISGRTW